MYGMKRLRVYADTSVFGGCFDEEFEVESRSFFQIVDRGGFTPRRVVLDFAGVGRSRQNPSVASWEM